MKKAFILLLLTIAIMLGIWRLYYLHANQGVTLTATPSAAHVAATIFPLYDIARNLAPDDVTVDLILPPGASPHTFELSPSTAHTLQQAQLVFTVGHGLDDWAVQNVDRKDVVTVDTDVHLRASVDEDDGPIDPHYWLSGENGKIIAKNIANALEQKYPEHAGDINLKYVAYLKKLQDAHETTHTLINEVGNKKIVTLHDAWYYFADAYGLQVVGTYTPSAGKEPLPQDLTKLQETLKTNGIQTFYVERQTSSASLQAFFDDNQLRVGTLDEIGGLPDTQSYIDLLLYNANVFANQP